MKMKAISPVRSLRRNTSNLSDLNLGTSRSKSPLEDHLSLLYNMNDCYSKLRELVPSLPQNRSVTKMEILQHVIDYILDLQTALDSNTAFVNLQHPPRQSQTMARKPSASLGTDISLISSQPCDPPRETQCDDNRTLSR